MRPSAAVAVAAAVVIAPSPMRDREPNPAQPVRRAIGPATGGRDGNGNRVVGMGDHMPSFIEKSFEDRRDS